MATKIIGFTFTFCALVAILFFATFNRKPAHVLSSIAKDAPNNFTTAAKQEPNAAVVPELVSYHPTVAGIADEDAKRDSDMPQPPEDLKNILLKHGIYFGTYLSEPDVAQAPPRPQNFLDQIAPYFDLYSIPAWYHHVEWAGPGQYNFNGTDKVADWAVAHNAKMHAHNLAWNVNYPPWLKDGTFTPDQLQQILKNHILATVGHYKDKYKGAVIAWDVVNEPIRSVYDKPGKSDPETWLRTCIWSAIHKPGSNDPSDYIQYAFEWAHEADPNVKLFINEGDIEYNGPKWDHLYALLKHLKEKGVPVDGVGFQAHLDTHANSSFDELLDHMNKLAALGMQAQITEMDVVISTAHVVPWSAAAVANPGREDLVAQANIYKGVLDACLRAKNCTALIVFGAWDYTSPQNNSWKDKDGKPIGPFHADILDDNFNPKEAYKALVEDANSKQ